MIRSSHGLGLALTAALLVAIAGCSVSTDDKSQGDDPNGSDTDGGASSSSNQPDEGTASDGAPASGSLSFAPANLPSDVPLGGSGDWIFNTDTCGSTKVTIDTAKGTVSCKGQANGAFAFKAINQADTSQGTLTAGLFVTRRLVIEPSMVVDVIGNRPLVIVALDTATIQGTLRASADKDHANGGGFDGTYKAVRGNGPGGGQPMSARAGAGGGGHCGVGGGSAGGKAYGSATNTPLIGGSSGGAGFGTSGGGGGAVQVVAGSSIEVSGAGAIEVSGGGADWYSGGGGAGGAILLEAPAVSVFGTLAANGGGGSEGGASNDGANGSASADPAKGGRGDGVNGGDGGDGSGGAIVDGQTGTQPDSTRQQGGGGGAAGWIRLNSNSGAATIGATAVISPSLTTPCATQGTPAAR